MDTNQLHFTSLKRTHEMFLGNIGAKPEEDLDTNHLLRKCKIQSEYQPYTDPTIIINERQREQILKRLSIAENIKSPILQPKPSDLREEIKTAEIMPDSKQTPKKSDLSLQAILSKAENAVAVRPKKEIKPQWHRPWKLMRVISGHRGWVRCLAMDPLNQFFVSGSNDRTIKFWDLATGQLKITLTGHISTVRGLVVSNRHPYLFSCSEDKNVYCWDLEQNKIVRKYHGHLSGIYSIALHPLLDVLVTGGRDSTARVWDLRTKANIHVLEGHTDTVGSVIAQEYEPQVITGGYDTMVKLWDLGTGKCMQTLTQHKKGIRSMVAHHEEYTFATGGADKIRVWKCPEGQPLRNIAGHNAIINSLALNKDNVLVSAADNGTMYFWDWNSGYNFQQIQSTPQPGSLSCEAGIFAAMFDNSSLRLITAECDKTIKVWKEDEDAIPENFPIKYTT